MILDLVAAEQLRFGSIKMWDELSRLPLVQVCKKSTMSTQVYWLHHKVINGTRTIHLLSLKLGQTCQFKRCQILNWAFPDTKPYHTPPLPCVLLPTIMVGYTYRRQPILNWLSTSHIHKTDSGRNMTIIIYMLWPPLTLKKPVHTYRRNLATGR